MGVGDHHGVPAPVRPRFAAVWTTSAFALGAVACGPEPDCLESRRALGADEASALGPTPAELEADAAVLGGTLDLRWNERTGAIDFDGAGGATSVTWSTTLDLAAAKFVKSRVNPDNTNDDVKICEDRVEIPGTLELRTDDGWFDEAAIPVRFEHRGPGAYGSPEAQVVTEQFDVVLVELVGGIASGTSPSEGGALDVQIARWASGTVDDAVIVRLGGLLRERSDDAVYVGVGEFGCAPAADEVCRDEGE